MKNFLCLFIIFLAISSCNNEKTNISKQNKTGSEIPLKKNKKEPQKLETEITKSSLQTIEDSIGEYSSYEITFQFETKDGVFNAYKEIPTLYLDRDSLKHFKHLKRAFTWLNGPTYLYYSKNRFFVPAVECYDNKLNLEKENNTYHLPYHIDYDSIPMNQVINITIKSIFVSSLLFSISNELTLNDTTWINNSKPIKCININGHLCNYTLMIYEETPTILDVIKRAKSIISKFGKDEEVLDEKLSKLIDKLNGQKIIVVAFCTC